MIGVDEEAAEGDDLLAFFQAASHFREELALETDLNLALRVTVRRVFHVHDAAIAGLDNRFIGNRDLLDLLSDDLEHVA